MADTTYKIIELVGTSEKSWEDAARNAVEAASETLKDLRIAEITRLDMTIENGKVKNYRARVNLSFRVFPSHTIEDGFLPNDSKR
nr:dodecin domain-containing protein [Desulfobacterales bacterium]